jgi:hypothetical protein
MPAASDAYAALLGRMPAYVDAAMERRKTKDDQAALDAQQAHYMREEQGKNERSDRADALQRADVAERKARADAAEERGRQAQREHNDQYAMNAEAVKRAKPRSWLGGNAEDAATHASANFVKMRLGVPGVY